MKRIGLIGLLVYYLAGSVCLPSGNFACGSDLAGIYRHCKAHEDKDMTPLDFVSDHLVNIDGIFDKHCGGDQQKPHLPVLFHHHISQSIILIQSFFNFSVKPIALLKKVTLHSEALYKTGHCYKFFHPPVS